MSKKAEKDGFRCLGCGHAIKGALPKACPHCGDSEDGWYGVVNA